MKKDKKNVYNAVCICCHQPFYRKSEKIYYCSDYCEIKIEKVIIPKSEIDRKKYYEKYKDKTYLRLKRYHLQNFELVIYNRLKYRANKKRIPFDLELKDIVIPEICPVLGIKIKKRWGEGIHQDAPSVDRLDPTKGYTKENIWIISWKANRIKSDLNFTELRNFCKGILRKIREIENTDQ